MSSHTKHAKKTLLLLTLLAVQAGAEPLFPPMAQCSQHQQFAYDLLRVPAAARSREVAAIPDYCRGDAVAQAVHDLRQQQRLNESIALANDFLAENPCDPSPYYEAAVSYEAVGKNELAACYYNKAQALTKSDKPRSSIRTDYARVSTTLPAVPKNELACSQLLANRIKTCPRTRSVQLVTDAPPAVSASASLRIQFAYNSAGLDNQAYAQVEQLAKQLHQNPPARTLGIKLNAQEESGPGNGRVSHIKLVGHTDTKGSADYNLALSQQRAESVKQALANLLPGVAIQATGQGKRHPLVPNAMREADHAVNRRVELIMD